MDRTIEGTWVNERGSTVTLRRTGPHLTGTYRTAVGHPAATDGFEVIGTTNGDLVTFAVAWVGFGSLTTWTGRYDPATDTIDTLWHLVRSTTTGFDEAGRAVVTPVELWNAFTTQASRFSRIAPAGG